MLISIVIPAKNEALNIEKCITGILNQDIEGELEIIVLDSGSTDGTIEILKKFPVKIINIDPSDFNHGETRNVGVRESKGEFVVLTVGDAIPANKFWIKNMLVHFQDKDVAGVCGKQVVPHEKDKNPAQWFRPQSELIARKIHFTNPVDFNKLTTTEQYKLISWDDVTAMYRGDIIRNKIPFERTSYSEDKIWARMALVEGYAIMYEPNAQVFHYHHEDFRFTFKRSITVNFHNYKIFRVKPNIHGFFFSLIHAYYIIIKEKKLSFLEKINWMGFNSKQLITNRVASILFLITLFFKKDKGIERLHAFYCKRPPISKRK